MAIKNTKSIFRGYYNIYKNIETDFGGGSIMSKTYLMAYLLDYFNLKTYVEIGVYKGKSLLPLSYVVGQNNGFAIGIDPYNNEDAKEYDVEEEKMKLINKFIDDLDFNSIYQEVIINKERFDLSKYCTIIRKTSRDAIAEIIKNKTTIGMLHIDGNHDTKFVREDINKYLPLVEDGGFVVFDDIDWESVNTVYQEAKKGLIVIFESDTYGILMKCDMSITNSDKGKRLNKKLVFLEKKIEKTEKDLIDGSYDTKIPEVGIGILTYNHQKFIEECLTGVFCQVGKFNATVYILDDNSTDYTYDIIKNYVERNSDNLTDFKIELIENEKNLGVVSSFKKLTKLLNNYDFVTICEGDDYWIDQYRIQKHIDFLKEKPECAVSFNSANVLYEESKKIELSEIHKALKTDRYCTEDLLSIYIIGNESCAFYDGKVFNNLPDDLFELFIGDWMFNIFCSSYGDIGYIKDIMNVYRKHGGGIWSCVNQLSRAKDMIKNIDEYNKYTNYMFDKEFTDARNQSIIVVDEQYSENLDLIIVDDIFPLNLSGFRYQEFTSYLKEIDNTKVLCTGQTVPAFTKKTIDELIIEYKRENELSGNVSKFTYWRPAGCKLLYFVFPTNAYNCLDIIEHYGIPFVFTLYPGGGFVLDNYESDFRLKRLMQSPCFKKVIVTQQITYDYLIKKNLCDDNKIEFIFGGVMPLGNLDLIKNYKKLHYGIDKERLDICFMAQKYTKYGQDKGYDTFIEVARILRKKHSNIFFHVVGGFDKYTIDVSDIEDGIKFYGILNIDEFDDFFVDKDIIVSPNVPNKLAKGAFDGFPTGSCVEAGLRGTAILCTDLLNLNGNRIVDGEEIIIIPNVATQISKIIENYYSAPQDLKKLGESLQKKLFYIFSYEYQIAPRIKLLREEISKPFALSSEDKDIIKSISKVSKKNVGVSKRAVLRHKMGMIYREHCPSVIKLIYRYTKKVIKIILRK